MRQFATCHCHPSSLDSAATPQQFAEWESQHGSPAVTCTDHGSMAATYQVYSLAKKKNLVPILGVEGYFRDDQCPILGEAGVPKTRYSPSDGDGEKYPHGSFREYWKYGHITLHFADYRAYQAGMRVLWDAHARAEQHGSENKPLFDWGHIEELAAHNVTATSSCLVGMVQRHLVDHQNIDVAKKYYERLKHLFRERFFVELFPHVCSHHWISGVVVEVQDANGTRSQVHLSERKKVQTDASPNGITATHLIGNSRHTRLLGIKKYQEWVPCDYKILSAKLHEGFVQNECRPWSPNGDLQWSCNMALRSWAKRDGVKILIADDSHFTEPIQKIIQDVRLAQGGSNWRFAGSYHRQTSQEAWEYFQSRMGISEKEFESWVDNSYEWVDRFRNFELPTQTSLPTKFFPSDTLAYTKQLILMHGRMPNDSRYIDRLKQELDLLHRNGHIDLLPYFFIDEEICRVYSQNNLLTGIGRGSAAGLLLSYLLGITHIDPIRYGLSLDRFLTLDRIKSGKLPDIDQDLPRRDLLEGGEGPRITWEAEDGTVHTTPADFRIRTDSGEIVTIKEAFERGLSFQPWWREKNEGCENPK